MGKKSSKKRNAETPDSSKRQLLGQLWIAEPMVEYQIEMTIDTPRHTNAFEQMLLTLAQQSFDVPLFDLFEQYLAVPQAESFVLPIINQLERDELLRRIDSQTSWKTIKATEIELTERGVIAHRQRRYPQTPVREGSQLYWYPIRESVRWNALSNQTEQTPDLETEEILEPAEWFENHGLGEVAALLKSAKKSWFKEDSELTNVEMLSLTQKSLCFQVCWHITPQGVVTLQNQHDHRLVGRFARTELVEKLQQPLCIPIEQLSILSYADASERYRSLSFQSWKVIQEFAAMRKNVRLIHAGLYSDTKIVWGNDVKWQIIFAASENRIETAEISPQKGLTIFTTAFMPDGVVYGQDRGQWAQIGLTMPFMDATEPTTFHALAESKTQLDLESVILELLPWLRAENPDLLMALSSNVDLLTEMMVSQCPDMFDALERCGELIANKKDLLRPYEVCTAIQRRLLADWCEEQTNNQREITFSQLIQLQAYAATPHGQRTLRSVETKDQMKQVLMEGLAVPMTQDELNGYQQVWTELFAAELSLGTRLFPEALLAGAFVKIGQPDWTPPACDFEPTQERMITDVHEHLMLCHAELTFEREVRLVDLHSAWQGRFATSPMISSVVSEACQRLLTNSDRFAHLWDNSHPLLREHRQSKLVVFDTSTLIAMPDLLNRIFTTPSFCTFIPSIVHHRELDGLKNSAEESTAQAARQLNRLLQTDKNDAKWLDLPAELSLLRADQQSDPPNNDDYIVSSMLRLYKLKERLHCVTNDNVMRNRLATFGFTVLDAAGFTAELDSLKHKKKKKKKKKKS